MHQPNDQPPTETRPAADPRPTDAELHTSHPTPRPPHPGDPRISIAANAIGWELHHRDREVTDRGGGNAQITVTATEAAAGRAIAERVIAQLDQYAAGEHELSAAGPDPDQLTRGLATVATALVLPRRDDYADLPDAALPAAVLRLAEQLAAYIHDGGKPEPEGPTP